VASSVPRTGCGAPASASTTPPASARPASISGVQAANRREIRVPSNSRHSSGNTITWTLIRTVEMPAPTSRMPAVHMV